MGSHLTSIGALVAETSGGGNFVELDVHLWQWGVLLGVITTMLLVDLLVFHREAHEVTTRQAAIESAIWVSCGVAFTGVIWWWFGSQASGEYISGYLIEKSLSVDNVFVWALIMGYFLVPRMYQHRVLFWGIFGALVLRAIFIFAGVALIEKFDWILYVFGAFLLYTAAKLVFGKDSSIDPGDSKFLKLVNRIVPSTDEYDGQKLFTIKNGKRLATPLFAVLMLVEATDVIFAVDSVPAVLAVSHEQFIVFASNAFAILGLRALYFLLADMHARFAYLQEGLAIILAFVGMKMLIAEWYHIPTALSLAVIAIVLTASIGISLKVDRSEEEEELVHRAFEGPESDESDAPTAPPDERSPTDV